MAVEELFTAELGLPNMSNDEYMYNCPFCPHDTKHKLGLHVGSGKRYGLWQCFRCGSRGNPAKFVMMLYGISYKDALQELEAFDYSPDGQWESPQSLGITDEEYLLLTLRDIFNNREVEEEEEKLTPPPLPIGYKRIVDNLTNPEVIPFLQYAERRGFSLQDLITHNVGYVINGSATLPDGRSLTIRNHLVFLTHGDNGEYLYWNTRAIYKADLKTLNAPSTPEEYSKRTVIFNLNRAKRTPAIVINEGVPDALTVGESGVATFGKQLTKEQKKLLTKGLHSEQKLYILLDNDAKKQIKTLAEDLYKEHRNTFIVLNPKGLDANDMGRDAVWELINHHAVRADAQGILTMMLTI